MNNITRTSTTELIIELAKRIESAEPIDKQREREKALRNQVGELKSECALLAERIDEMKDSAFADGNTIKHLKSELDKLRKEKEASSAPCGCQAYRDLEEKVGDLEYSEDALAQANGIISEMRKREKELNSKVGQMERDLTVKTSQAEAWRKEYEKAKKEADRLSSMVLGQCEYIIDLESKLSRQSSTSK